MNQIVITSDPVADEEWRVIAEAPSYAVSSFGRVKRIVQARTSPAGKIIRPGKTGSMKYLTVNLRIEGKSVGHYVHALVCAAFRGPRPTDLHQAAHFDGDQYNNVEANLRWATWHENYEDKVRHGRAATGDRHPSKTGRLKPQAGENHWSKRMPEKVPHGEAQGMSKLTEEQVRTIKSTPGYWGVNASLARQYGICSTVVGEIRRGILWRHVDV